MPERLYTLDELAEYLDVAPRTVRQWNYQGRAPRRHKVGREVRYAESDVKEWLARQAVEDARAS